MRKALGTIALTGALFLAPAAIASADTSSPAPVAISAVTNPVNVDDNNDKTGLWGLLGLLGLAGLIRRTPDRSNDYSNDSARL